MVKYLLIQAMCVQLLLIRYNITFWTEWVDSDSNLADGFSRDNMEAPWTWDHIGIT